MPDDCLAPFLAHIKRCQTAIIPENRRRLLVEGKHCGWVDSRLFEALTLLGFAREKEFTVANGSDLESLGERLAAMDLYRPHNELFDVSDLDGRVVGQIDRGVLPLLGCTAVGVHLNGLVEKPEGLHLWMGRRALDKRLDPGKLDHLAAGGVCAGLSPMDALVKEAGEEAAIPPALAARAVKVATIRYAMSRPEGLRQDTLYCYDLTLPEDFTPQPVDGEVAFFDLMSLEQVFQIVRDTTDVKFNVNLVLIDLFLRRELFPARESALLRHALHQQ